jgi:hypothetical protein
VTEGPTARTPDGTGSGRGRSLRELVKDRRLSATALLAIAGLVALAVWLVVESVSDDDGSGTAATAQTTDAVAVSANGLATVAQAGGSPIYWVGPRKGVMYELRQTGGQFYVRYLPSGVRAGDSRPLLTIATYPVDNAFDVTSSIAGSNTEKIPIEGGGIAVLTSDRPSSAYVAFPGVDYQVELYDPDPKVVRRLATSGAVKAVPPQVATATVEARGPEAVTEKELVAVSKDLDQPLYWAGPREDTTYELTVTGEGRVFIRYLPSGVEPGDETLFLTIAMYPFDDAYNVTKRSATSADIIEDPHGGVAVKGTANNVYLAYPGQDVQVEVYSPTPGEAARLVQQGKIVPVE